MAKKIFQDDTDMCLQFGDWWLEEMDFRDDMTDEEKLAQANRELETRGFTERVTEVAETEESLLWIYQ